MNKSKAIGTKAETAVVKVLQARGWPKAERRALAGEHDKGDIINVPGITIQVKGGHMAESASDTVVKEWMVSTEQQRVVNKDIIGLLVWKRYAVGEANAHRWWAGLDAQWVANLLGAGDGGIVDSTPIGITTRMTLEEVIELLHQCGYGDD